MFKNLLNGLGLDDIPNKMTSQDPKDRSSLQEVRRDLFHQLIANTPAADFDENVQNLCNVYREEERQAEAEALRLAEEEQRRRQAEEQRRRQAEEQRRRQAEEQRRRQAEEQRRQAELRRREEIVLAEQAKLAEIYRQYEAQCLEEEKREQEEERRQAEERRLQRLEEARRRHIEERRQEEERRQQESARPAAKPPVESLSDRIRKKAQAQAQAKAQAKALQAIPLAPAVPPKKNVAPQIPAAKVPAAKKEAPVPVAIAGGYLNNCGMHCVIHKLFALPEAQLRELAEQHPIFDKLFQELHHYYQLQGPYNREAIFALNQQFNHPRDREVLWGQVFRRTLRRLLNSENVHPREKENNLILTRDLNFLDVDIIAKLTKAMGAKLVAHSEVANPLINKFENFEPEDELPTWEIHLYGSGNHFNFTFGEPYQNLVHNFVYAQRDHSKLYQASHLVGILNQYEAIKNIVTDTHRTCQALAVEVMPAAEEAPVFPPVAVKPIQISRLTQLDLDKQVHEPTKVVPPAGVPAKKPLWILNKIKAK